MAFYKYFWDLANSETYVTHTVGSFDNNTTTGGGVFRWIPYANNSSITNIAGIRIKPENTTNGYWERVWDGAMSVGWFGCQNLNSVLTFAQLGVSQDTLDIRYGPGFATTTDNYDTTAIRYALHVMNMLGNQGLVFEPKVYWLTRMCELPAATSSTTVVDMFVIDGNGATIRRGNTSQFTFFKRMPTDMAEQTTFIPNTFTFKNFSADGGSGTWQNSGYAFLELGASTGSIIDNININNFDIGLRLENCPSITVSNVLSYAINSYTIRLTSGSWTGANPSNTLSPDATIKNVYIYDTLSQDVGIYLEDTDNALIDKVTLQTSTNTLGEAAIKIKETGTATVTSTKITNSHFDVTGLNDPGAMIKYEILTPSSLHVVDGVVIKQPINTVYVKTGVGIVINVYISNIGIWPVGTMLVNEGTSKWDFYNVNFGPGITTPADIVDPINNLWDTTAPAVIPSVSDILYVPVGVPVIPTLQQVLDYNHDLVDGFVFMGTGAGNANTGATEVIAIGSNAADTNSGDQVVAIGDGAGANNSGSIVVAIGLDAADNNTNDDVIAIGSSAATQNTGDYVTAIGSYAGDSNTGTQLVAIGNGAANGNSGDNLVAVGTYASSANTASDVVAIGRDSATSNSGNNLVAVGQNAGTGNTGNGVIAIGLDAAQANTSSIIAIGESAGSSNSGGNVIGVGRNAALSNTGDHVTALGRSAASGNSADNVIAIGKDVAGTNSGDNTVMIGVSAGTNNTGDELVAVGFEAGKDNTGLYVVAVGREATETNSGSNVVGIGYNAAKTNTGDHVIAIGNGAANTNGDSGVVAIGKDAYTNISGSPLPGTAVGYEAGSSAYGGTYVGYWAGKNSTASGVYIGTATGINSTGIGGVVAIGSQAVNANSGDNIIGIGDSAASSNSGNDVIAIGYNAALNNTASGVIALGHNAGMDPTGPTYNTLLGPSFIINNSFLPSYANFAAAAAAITVLNGAVINNTYLYHDQATNSIGAVRL